MTNTFTQSPRYLLTSESVTEGHPDKLCDQVSDAILDAILANDPRGRVACETAVTTGLVVVMGEITTSTYVDIPQIVRDTIRGIGYTNALYGIDYNTCGVIVSVKEQSQDISQAVSHSLETRENSSSGNEIEELGAGDQGMMVGFACTETAELMPLPISLAHALCKQLSIVRKEGLLPYLRPDGKSQVTVRYVNGKPVEVTTVVISSQHMEGTNQTQLRDEVIEAGEDAKPGQIFDANRPMLLSLAEGWHYQPVDLGHAPDDPDEIAARLSQGARDADVILTSGGASAGDAVPKGAWKSKRV